MQVLLLLAGKSRKNTRDLFAFCWAQRCWEFFLFRRPGHIVTKSLTSSVHLPYFFFWWLWEQYVSQAILIYSAFSISSLAFLANAGLLPDILHPSILAFLLQGKTWSLQHLPFFVCVLTLGWAQNTPYGKFLEKETQEPLCPFFYSTSTSLTTKFSLASPPLSPHFLFQILQKLFMACIIPIWLSPL